MQAFPSSKLPDAPTAAPLGSKARIEELARRAERGEGLFHPADNDSMEGVDPAELPAAQSSRAEKIRSKPGEAGVERERRGRWRARTYWNKKKHTLGFFATRREAVKRARQFWIDTLGLFYLHRSGARAWMKPLPDHRAPRLPRKRRPKKKRPHKKCLFCARRKRKRAKAKKCWAA
jgi:hypothetical protein